MAVDGRFQIEGLEPGEYGVSAFLGPNRLGFMVHGWSQVTVPARGSVDVTVELKPRER